MSGYDFDDASWVDVDTARVHTPDEFVSHLTDSLSEGYRFLTPQQVQEGIPHGRTHIISDRLLGSISEFALFVVLKDVHSTDHPFLGCFRAADPLGRANFPLIDIRLFLPGSTPTDDRLWIIELKATRDNPAYFTACLDDFAALYTRSRLISTVEQIKHDMKYGGHADLVRRVNDCVGTCAADSHKLILVPAGVSGDTCTEDDCIAELQSIVSQLSRAGWKDCRGVYLLVPDIEGTYTSFAVGGGLR